MNRRLMLVAVAGLAFATLHSFAAEDKKFKANCPISGKAAKEGSTAAYLGKKVYFCCDNCPKAFTANPKKYAAKAHHQLVQTEQVVQVACPLTGGKINPKAAIKVDGVEVAFCCNNCRGKATKAKDQVKLVFAKLDKGFTLQNKCPLSGKKIDPTKTVATYKGKKVYFCCDGCPAAFKKDPAKYAAKLPQLKTK